MIDLPTSTADIVAFVTSADAGSFAGGAQRLGLSRSAVAKAVARLEARLGTRLMTRTTRRLTLTADGRTFHMHCSAILDELRAAEAALAQRGEGPRGILRLAAPDAYGRLRVMSLVAHYLALYPAVQVELGLSDRLSGIVAEGLDLAIRIGHPRDLPPDLVGRVVDRVRHGFFASAGYLAARGRPADLAGLAGHDGIVYGREPPHRHWRVLSEDGTWQAPEARHRISVDSGEGLLQAAMSGLGIAFLPEFLAEDAVARGRLERILPDCRMGELPVLALYPSRRNLPRKTRAFLDLLPGLRGEDRDGRVGPEDGARPGSGAA